MNILKALGAVDFTKYALLPISQYVHWMKIDIEVQNAVNLSKIFFGIKLLHAHQQYVCNIPAKYQMNILKALGGVISQSMHYHPLVNMYSGRKLAKLKML